MQAREMRHDGPGGLGHVIVWAPFCVQLHVEGILKVTVFAYFTLITEGMPACCA